MEIIIPNPLREMNWTLPSNLFFFKSSWPIWLRFVLWAEVYCCIYVLNAPSYPLYMDDPLLVGLCTQYPRSSSHRRHEVASPVKKTVYTMYTMHTVYTLSMPADDSFVHLLLLPKVCRKNVFNKTDLLQPESSRGAGQASVRPCWEKVRSIENYHLFPRLNL